MAEAKPAEETKQVFEIYIKTTPEKLWQALTDGDYTEKYYFGTRISTDLTAGGVYDYSGGGNAAITGKVLEIDPPRKLVMSFDPLWCGGEAVDLHTSRVTWEITVFGEACQLRLTHDELLAGDPNNESFRGGWAAILSGLKTLLETGEPLAITPPGNSEQ